MVVVVVISRVKSTPQGRRQRGADLLAARKKAGLTRADVAALAGCSMTYLQNLEAGVIPRRSEVLPRVCEALGLSLKDEGSAPPEPLATTSAGTGDGHGSG